MGGYWAPPIAASLNAPDRDRHMKEIRAIKKNFRGPSDGDHMLTRRRRATAAEAAPRAAQPFSVDELLDGPRPGRVDADRDRAWRDIRARLSLAMQGTEFDLRQALRLEGDALGLWQARRRAWSVEWMRREGV